MPVPLLHCNFYQVNAMRPEEKTRKDRFDELFSRVRAGTNADRLRWVAAAIDVKPNTVRIWRLRRPTRIPADRSLALLEREIQRAGW